MFFESGGGDRDDVAAIVEVASADAKRDDDSRARNRSRADGEGVEIRDTMARFRSTTTFVIVNKVMEVW
jgi:hypothetical protein